MRFCWMHATVGVWFGFVLALFVVEPLGLQRGASATVVTILGAVAGSHGWIL